MRFGREKLLPMDENMSFGSFIYVFLPVNQGKVYCRMYVAVRIQSVQNILFDLQIFENFIPYYCSPLTAAHVKLIVIRFKEINKQILCICRLIPMSECK